jgi:hypothetical protein
MMDILSLTPAQYQVFLDLLLASMIALMVVVVWHYAERRYTRRRDSFPSTGEFARCACGRLMPTGARRCFVCNIDRIIEREEI